MTLVDRETRTGEVRARPVNACLFPLYAAEGSAVVTVEGLEGPEGEKRSGGSGGGLLHPLPAALANAHGSQCGFCSPGFVMAAHSCLASHAARERRRQGNEDGNADGTKEGCPAAATSSSSPPCLPQRKPAEDIEDVFSGNLCRCTGYRPLVDAFRPFFDEGEKGGGGGAAEEGRRFAAPARPSGEVKEEASPSSYTVDASSLLPRELLTRPKPELHFPVTSGEGEGGVEWHRPTSLRSLLSLRASSALLRGGSSCTLIGGSTEVQIECSQKGARHAIRVDVGSVPEMAALDFGDGRKEAGDGDGNRDISISIGAGATLEDLLESARRSSLTSGAAFALAFQLRRFAGRAVRAAAVVGGNVATASPASDLNPVFVALGAFFDIARLDVVSQDIALRSVPAAEFFKGYRQVDLAPAEVLLRVRLPRWGGDGRVAVAAAVGDETSSSPPLRRRPLDFVQAFKQARRRDDDISIVTACLAVRFEAQKVEKEGGEGEEAFAFVVAEASFCFGGVAATPLVAPRAARSLVGSRWSLEDYEKALWALTNEDVVIPDEAPGGAVPFRRALVASAFARFFASAHRRLLAVFSKSSSAASLSPPPALPPWLSAASEGLPPRPPPRSLQYWGEEAEEREDSTSGKSDPGVVIGAPVQHLSAGLQASGAARYVADEPLLPGTLHGALVLSTRAAARVASVDASKALASISSSGVNSSASSSDCFFFGAADVPGLNRWGPFLGDPLFLGVGDSSEAVGLPLGIVVARSEASARRAALLVEVEYESENDDDRNDEKSVDGGKRLNKPILTIEDAISANSFFEGMDREIEHGAGDIDALFEGYRREPGKGGKETRKVAVVEGSIRIGGQEHFYLEPHSALAVPGETGTSNEIDVLSSTQAPYGTQLDVARACGLPMHSVVCRATRLGGGFGGKETRAGGVAAAAAVAAFVTKRPVRLVLERHVDAAISGGVSRFLFFRFSRSKVEAERRGRPKTQI